MGLSNCGGNQESDRRSGTILTYHSGSFLWKQRRHTRHFTCGIFLVSLWFCVLGDGNLLNGRAANAEGPILPSISSASSSSVSKARIVIPSFDQEEDILGSDHYRIQEKSVVSESSVDITNNPVAFLSRKELRPSKSNQKLSPVFSPKFDLEEEEEFDARLPTGAIPSPSKSSFKKTGTTIAGCVVQGDKGPYVVLAADTRATENTLVADKRCDKIHKLSANCRCCGAGTSADLDKTTRQVLYQVALQELQNGDIGNLGSNNSQEGHSELLYPEHGDDEPLLWMRPVSIEVLCSIFQDMLFQSGGQLGANLIVGGVWKNKAYLRAIHPHGSTDVDLPFTALGSGGLAAMAVLEDGYKPSLTLKEGVDLVQRAILSGIRNDLGSGSQVDLCVIYPDGKCQQTRAVIPEEELLPDGSDTTTSGPSNHLLELLGNQENDGNEEYANSSTTANSGVNGFGNQPFAIENTKQRMVSVEVDREKQKEKWDRVLGL